MDFLHRGTDDAFDDPAVLRLPERAIIQVNPVLLTPAGQRLALELTRIIDIQGPRFPTHRLGNIQPELL